MIVRLNRPLVVCSLLLSSCLPEEMDRSAGQIVVVGNGADWNSAVVVDVNQSSESQSLILTQDGLDPVMELLGFEGRKSKVDWIAPSPTGEALVKVSDVSTQAQGVVKTDSNGERTEVNEFGALDFSSGYSPLYLSDRSLLYVNVKNELRWSRSGEVGILIAEKFDYFFVTGGGDLVVKRRNFFHIINLKTLAKRWADVDAEGELRFPRVLAQGVFADVQGQLFFFLLNSVATGNLQGVYRFDTKTSQLVLAHTILDPNLRVKEILKLPESQDIRNRFVALVRFEDGELGVLQATATSTVRVPVHDLNDQSRLFVGQDHLAVLGDKFQICNKSCEVHQIDGLVQDIIFGPSQNLLVATRDEALDDEEFRILDYPLAVEIPKQSAEKFVSAIDEVVTEDDDFDLMKDPVRSLELVGGFEGFRKFSAPPRLNVADQN